MEQSVINRQKIERKIASQVIKSAIAAGYTFLIVNGEDETETSKYTQTLNAMFQTDMDKLYLMKDGKSVGWVLFVYGNDGWDVISDYTVNLEELLKPTRELADSLAG